MFYPILVLFYLSLLPLIVLGILLPVVDFKLSVAAYGLNKTPGQHVFHLVENDTIVGWGKMTVYTPNGNSIPYDVLMLQSEFYALDSFYLGGSPAPTALLNTFGITQGQKTAANYAYNFHRKGSYNYLVRQYYADDNTFSTMSDAYIATDNVNTTGLDDAKPLYTSLLYPNPTNTSQLNVQIIGKEVQLSQYVVMDIMGRTVQEGSPEESGNGAYRLKLNDNIVNGSYLVKMLDKDNQPIVLEKFNLIR
jgi:Secretion system C-terminal sorting domain